jgi:hypothetical protein
MAESAEEPGAKQAAYDARYRGTHRQKVLERKAAYRAANREKIKAAMAAYRAAHLEELRVKERARDAKRRSGSRRLQVLEAKAAYRAAKRAEIKAAAARYRAEHLEELRQKEAQRKRDAKQRRGHPQPCLVCWAWRRVSGRPMRCPLCDPVPLGDMPDALVLNAILFTR